MELREEKRGPSKLEYALISILAVVVIWAAWIMLEPVVWPALEHFVETAFEEVAATPTPTPAPEPELSRARPSRSLALST